MTCKPSKLQMLEDAKAKYHLLITGQAVRVVVDSDGGRVEFNTANRSALQEYIGSLEKELGTVPAKRRGPIGFAM